jgi:hypothetical protein
MQRLLQFSPSQQMWHQLLKIWLLLQKEKYLLHHKLIQQSQSLSIHHQNHDILTIMLANYSTSGEPPSLQFVVVNAATMGYLLDASEE